MTRLQQGLFLVFGLPVLAIGGTVWHALANAEDRLATVCPQFAEGMSLAAATTLAENQALRGSLAADGTSYLGEAWSYERYGCQVTLRQGIVASARVARRE